MMRYAVSNDEETVTIHVWAFNEDDAVYRVEQLTGAKEFRKVKHVGTVRVGDSDSLVRTVYN